MGISRNSINITGITPEDRLPREINGQIMEYSEVEHIYTPEDKARINTIHQISIKIETTVGRTINSPTGKIVVLDGVKKIKIVYTHKSKSDKAVVVDIRLPYNTFIDLPSNCGEITDINVYVVDAYFYQMDSRKLYSHIVYMVHVQYPMEDNIRNSKYTNELDVEID